MWGRAGLQRCHGIVLSFERRKSMMNFKVGRKRGRRWVVPLAVAASVTAGLVVSAAAADLAITKGPAVETAAPAEATKPAETAKSAETAKPAPAVARPAVAAEAPVVKTALMPHRIVRRPAPRWRVASIYPRWMPYPIIHGIGF